MRHNWFNRLLVTLIKTGAAYVFDFCCEIRPVDMSFCSGDIPFDALVPWLDEISDFST